MSPYMPTAPKCKECERLKAWLVLIAGMNVRLDVAVARAKDALAGKEPPKDG